MQIRKPICSFGAILLFLGYCTFWWVLKLEELPGLHGDEAWAGLKADEFINSGVHETQGMTYYTGILQPGIVSFFFKKFGIGVVQLRVGGYIFNLLGITLLFFTFFKSGFHRMVLFLALLFGQSTLFLSVARVAWEVNTFTVFFIALLVWSCGNILKTKKDIRYLWITVFMLVNLMGTYNHILFSCFSVAIWFTTALCTYQHGRIKFLDFAVIVTLNLLNIVMLATFVLYFHPWITILVPSFIIVIPIELWLIRMMVHQNFHKFHWQPSQKVFQLILALMIGSFLIFHGMAFLDALSNYKTLVHLYSYEFNIVWKSTFILLGAVVATYLTKFLFDDIVQKEKPFPALFIISYGGILSMYTISNSSRYYLVILTITYIYLAFKLADSRHMWHPLTLTLLVMTLLVNVFMLTIYVPAKRNIKAIQFTIGNGNEETSAHFLPMESLVDSLRKHRINDIDCVSDQFFLENPIRFYYLIAPWQRVEGNGAMIYYDYHGLGNGFLLRYFSITDPH